MTEGNSSRHGTSSNRSLPWLRIPLALVCLCLPVPAGAADGATAEWRKLCEALPDTNCLTAIELGDENGGPVNPSRGALAALVILEPKRDAPAKMLRAIVNFP